MMPSPNNRVRVFSVLVIVFGVTLVLFTTCVESAPVDSLADGLVREEDNEIHTDGYRVVHVRERKSIRNGIEPLTSKVDNQGNGKHFSTEVNGDKNINDNLKKLSEISGRNNSDNYTKNINSNNNNDNSDNANAIKVERKNKRKPVDSIKSGRKHQLNNGENIDRIIFSEHGDQLPLSRRSPRQSSPIVFLKSDDGSLRLAPDSATPADRFGVDEYDGRGSMAQMNEMMSTRYDGMSDYGYIPANRLSVGETDPMLMTETYGYEPILGVANYDPAFVNKNDDFGSAYMIPDNSGYESAMFRPADGSFPVNYADNGYVSRTSYGEYDGPRRSGDSNYRTADDGKMEFTPMDDYNPSSRTLNIGHETSSFPESGVTSPIDLKTQKEQPQHPDGHHEPPIVVVQPLVIPISRPGCLLPSENPHLHHHKPLSKPNISLPSLSGILKPGLLNILKPDFLDIPKPDLPDIPKPDFPVFPKPHRPLSISKPPEVPVIPKPDLPMSHQPHLPSPPSSPPHRPSPPFLQPPVKKPVIYVNKEFIVDANPIQATVYDTADVQQHPPMIHRTFVMQPGGRIQAYTSASPAPYRDPLPFDARQQLGDDYYVKEPYVINVPPHERAQNDVIMVKPQTVEEILLGMETPKLMLPGGNQDLSKNNTLSEAEIMRGALQGGGSGFDYGAMVPILGTPPQQQPSADPLRAYMVSRMKKIDQEVGELSRKLDTLQIQQRLAHVLAGDPAFLRRGTQRKRENRQEKEEEEGEEEEKEICCEETKDENEEEERVQETRKAADETEEKLKEKEETRKDDNREAVKAKSAKEENKKATKESAVVSDKTKTQSNNKARM